MYNRADFVLNSTKMLLLLVIAIALRTVTADPIGSRPVQSKSNLGITGGDVAVIEDVPYEVIVEYSDKSFCAGSIVSDHYVVTMGVCILGANNETVIRAGSSLRGSGGTTHKIEKTILHPGKDDRYLIALVRVVEPFQFDRTRKHIPLFDQNEEIPAGKKGIVSGWGNTEAVNSYNNEQLYKIEMTILDHEICEKANVGNLKGKVICAMNDEGKGKDLCIGDVTDPLVIDGHLAGLAAGSENPCTGTSPAIYINIARYRDWIDENVQ